MTTELTKPAQLQCIIVDRSYGGSEPCLTYQVFAEDGVMIQQGVSSSEDWVRHDAGGYHTKTKFDEMFPQGWNVNFEF